MEHQLSSIPEIVCMYQERHNHEIEYLPQAMFNMTMNVIHLKTEIEGVLAMAMPNTLKQQADFMDWEFTLTPVVVVDLTINLGCQIQKGKKKLTRNEDTEVKANRDVRDRHGGTAPPPPREQH